MVHKALVSLHYSLLFLDYGVESLSLRSVMAIGVFVFDKRTVCGALGCLANQNRVPCGKEGFREIHLMSRLRIIEKCDDVQMYILRK